jgi:hypothetical protein
MRSSSKCTRCRAIHSGDLKAQNTRISSELERSVDHELTPRVPREVVAQAVHIRLAGAQGRTEQQVLQQSTWSETEIKQHRGKLVSLTSGVWLSTVPKEAPDSASSSSLATPRGCSL